MSKTENKSPSSPGGLVIEFGKRDVGLASFERSIHTILTAAAVHQNAIAVFLYEYLANERRLSLLDRAGRFEARLQTARIELPEAVAQWLNTLSAPVFIRKAAEHDLVASFPEVFLHAFDNFAVVPVTSAEGIVAFLNIGWRDLDSDPDLSSVVTLTHGLARILAEARQTIQVEKLAAEVVRTQWELADHKISERVSGVGEPYTGVSPEVVRQHIERVLNSAGLTEDLEDRLQTLRTELDGRLLIAKAKEILQRTLGMTEQQAYLHLQRTSRESRRPLREVAGELIEGGHSAATGQPGRRTA